MEIKKMENPLETFENGKFKAEIYYDYNAESSREWDNIGKMLCWHNRYTLGDEKLHDDYCYTKECKLKNLTDYCNNWEEVEEVLKKEFKAVVILPLYLYDHSGLSMRTYRHGQHSNWDCGCVGFIYATREQLLKEYNQTKITKSIIEKAEKILISEVETYSKYLSGEVYGYVIRDDDNNNIESCWGFYGDDVIEEAKNMLNSIVKEYEENILQTKCLVFG